MTAELAIRQPVLYLSHGAPPLADDALWTSQLHDWSSSLTAATGKPTAILMVSAHWEQDPLTISSTQPGIGLVYDFWGFPQHYYQVTYAAPPAAALASRVAAILGEHTPVRHDETRGLDHGAYVPLVEMFPQADVPVLQVSMPTLDPQALFELGRRLAPLRDEGVLIVGSGFTTHNLRWFNPGAPADAAPPTASSEFDHWAQEAMARQDLDQLLNFTEFAPAALEAHPRTEHWAPLYVALGAATAGSTPQITTEVDGFWYGLSKRSWQLN